MEEDKKDDGAIDPLKLLFEETLKRQRNAMMDIFS